MTPADLSRIEVLAREATPGPWRVLSDSYVIQNGPEYVADAMDGYDATAPATMAANAAYIAAANPAAVLALIAELTSLRAAVARVRGE